MLKYFKDINCSVDKNELCNKKQTFISDFFFQKNRFWNLKEDDFEYFLLKKALFDQKSPVNGSEYVKAY